MKNNFKYIFGIQENGKYADSFETVNDLDVYYDNDTHKYLWSVDFTSPNLEEKKTTKTSLPNIRRRSRKKCSL